LQDTAQPSPLSSSPASGTYKAPTSMPHGSGGAGLLQRRMKKTEPWSRAVQTSNSSAWRRSAPRPVPAVPAVETPSRRLVSRSRMPGPLSTASTSMPGVSTPDWARMMYSVPSPACLRMLVPASVITIARRPVCTSAKPSASANFWPARRAAATSLAWRIGKTICGCRELISVSI